jgi:hypothetical protein
VFVEEDVFALDVPVRNLLRAQVLQAEN